MTELLDWVEKAAIENLRFHLQSTENLTKEAQTTLTVLLAGLGASLAYALKDVGAGVFSDVTFGIIVLTIYLMINCALVVFKCMKIAPIPAPTNEPKNLYNVNYELAVLRKFELDNIQDRIDQAVRRNDATTAWLNRSRAMVVFSPVSFLVAYGHAPALCLCG